MQIQIITDEQTLENVISKAFNKLLKNQPKSKADNFENDKITRYEAAKLIGVSVTTLDKFIKSGKIKQYSTGGRKKFLFRSEVIEALKNMDK